MLQYPLKALLTVILTIMVSVNSYAAVSINTAQSILNQLTSANGLRPIKIQILNDNRINAYGGGGQVAVTKGLLKYGNRSMMIAILSHELAHARGMMSEVGADQASVGIARKAGLNVCPGAKQFLSTVGKVGGGSHPDGTTRLKRMGCI